MTVDTSKKTHRLDQQLARWLDEHRNLDAELNQFLKRTSAVHWPTEIQLLGIRSMLDRLSENLDAHFACEEQLIDELVAARSGNSTPEIEAVRRQSARDNLAVQSRVRTVRELLCDPLRARHSWTEIKVELHLIADLLEQHEEQERNSIAWLRPRNGSSQAFRA